eukprot:1275490-Prymnesium_polylepis.1
MQGVLRETRRSLAPPSALASALPGAAPDAVPSSATGCGADSSASGAIIAFRLPRAVITCYQPLYSEALERPCLDFG